MPKRYYHLNCPKREADNPTDCPEILSISDTVLECTECHTGLLKVTLQPTYPGDGLDDIFQSALNPDDHYEELAISLGC